MLRDCWDEINPSGDSKVHGKKVVKYMQALGLGEYEIREIWKIANADSIRSII
jgi:hypothetical protein